MSNVLMNFAKELAVNFGDFIAKNKWVFNGKPKHPDYWIQFQGKGRGYKKETTDSLYELFLEQERERLTPKP